MRCKVGENKGAAGVKGFGLLGATPRKKLRDDIASGSNSSTVGGHAAAGGLP